MRTRKVSVATLVSGVALCLAVYVSIFGVAAIGQQKDKKSVVASATILQPTPASMQTIAYPDTAQGRALDYGLHQLQSHVTDIPSFERLILDYLQRKYGLSQAFSASINPITPPTSAQEEDPGQFLAFRRIAYPNSLESILPNTHGDTMSQMLLEAVNCDHIPLPNNFMTIVNENMTAGGYNLTHVEFAIQRMSENHCSSFTSQQLGEIKTSLAAGMVQIASNPNELADLRYESIAFLMDMGRYDLINSSWIDEMVSAQLPGGGWAQSAAGEQARDHTTVVAAWALLEYTNRAARDEPMIHRPT